MEALSESLSDLIPTAQVAEQLGVTVAKVHRMMTAGALTPVAKFPGQTGGYLFNRRDVERLARARAEATR